MFKALKIFHDSIERQRQAIEELTTTANRVISNLDKYEVISISKKDKNVLTQH